MTRARRSYLLGVLATLIACAALVGAPIAAALCAAVTVAEEEAPTGHTRLEAQPPQALGWERTSRDERREARQWSHEVARLRSATPPRGAVVGPPPARDCRPRPLRC